MRRRSLTVAAPLLAATALALLSGCKQKEMQRCVDEHENVVDPKLCDAQNGHPLQQRVEQRPDGHGGFVPIFIPLYRTYYGGSGGYGVGDRVYGGGYTSVAGHSYANPSVTRGGFGHFFSSGS